MNQIRLTPIATGLVAGYADGWLEKGDKTAARTQFLQQYSTWLELALAVGGIFVETSGMARGPMASEVVEAGITAGWTLLGRKAFVMMPITPPAAYSIPYAVPNRAMPAYSPAVQKQPSLKVF